MENLKTSAYKWLRRSESFFKTDMIYLAKGSLWTSTRFGIGLVASVATIIAFGNLLPKEVYGTYSYLLSLAGTLGFLTLSGVGTGIIRAIARGQEEVVPYALRLQLRYNLLSTAAIGIAALYYLYKGNTVFSISLGLLALAMPISAAFHTFESILIGKKNFKALSLLTSLSSIVGAAAMIITLLLTHSVVIIISVYCAVLLIPSLYIYRQASNSLSNAAPSEEAINELRKTSFHLTGAGIISTFAQYLDKIILFQIAGPASLAVYGFAIAGPERLKGLVKNWASIVLPKLAEKTAGDIRSSFYKRLGFLVLLGTLLSLFYIFISPILFKFFLPKYLDSVAYSQVYALGMIVIPAQVYIGTVFYSLNMLRAVYLSSIGSQVLRIFLFLLLGWMWQTWGLIIASVIAYILSAFYGIIIWETESRRIIKQK